MKKIVNFSGGKSSGYMVNMIKNEKPIYIFCNTSKETKETYEFIKQCNDYFKMNLIVLEYKKGSFNLTNIDDCKKNGEIFETLINEKKYIPNVMARYCTIDMKIIPTKRYLKSIGIKNYINYLGIRADEPQRYSKIISRNTIKVYNDMPLYYNGITKKMVNDYWESMPFNLKHSSELGNCDLCFLKGKNKIINILRDNPAKADWWIKQEKNIGKSFKKDISYSDMLKLSKEPILNLFNDNNEIICNCNLDD